MAFDTVVDKAQLEGAMAASADAIREKTGDTAPIKWDADKGFSDAISNISSGGTELPELDNPGTAGDLAAGKQLIGEDGSVVTGNVQVISDEHFVYSGGQGYDNTNKELWATFTSDQDIIVKKGTEFSIISPVIEEIFGNARPENVAQGVTFTSENGLKLEGTALIPGGGFVYPDGAFAPVKAFTAGKQYALVALIDGVRRYINTTDYNQYTMNATPVTIAEDAEDYVIFSDTPVLFTAVASGDGFLLQNGNNYLHGTSSGGTALRVGTTQMVWTVDDSETGGFSEGKYYAKEDPDAVWLMNVSGGYNWSIKYETAGSFGYDREGRDNTYSTGFVPFILYEYVAGEGEVSPIVDTSDADVAASDMAAGKVAYVKGRRVTGDVQEYNGSYRTPSGTATIEFDDDWVIRNEITADALLRKGTRVETWLDQSVFGDAAPEDVRAGKTFTTGVAGLKATGTAVFGDTGSSGGSVIKSGTTTSATINTGLSDIEEFFIYKESVAATGLIHLHYSADDGTSYLYAYAWSTSMMGSKTVTNGTTAATVSGGSITLPSSTATSGGLSSGVTYKWIAIGTE